MHEQRAYFADGLPALAPSMQCVHEVLHVSVERISGRKLQRIRKRWFFAHPLCVQCSREGRLTLATELDHVVPLFKGGQDDDDNRQGLCSPCHERKTRVDMGHGPMPGCDANGWPIDPLHSWNRLT